MATETRVEIEARPVERSILVLQGRPLTRERVERIKADLEEALAENRWPLILSYDGPVYWVPIEREEAVDGSPPA